MDWLMAIRTSIDFIEENIKENISLSDAANAAHVSPYLFGKGFRIVTGYSVSEYIRNRRLYLAALALRGTEKSILDIALDLGYETPESFSKAFTRFHGNTPSAVRAGADFRVFLPLSIQVTIQGGTQMDYKITKFFGMKLIGFPKEFSVEASQGEIPKFWDDICEKYAANVYAGNPPANPQEKALMDNCIGEYAVCIDTPGNDTFRYMIAGKYTGGDVPEGMELFEFPMGDWAIFECVGPMPDAIQDMSNRIFKQWLPGNGEYELSGNATIEWYDCTTDKDDPNYRSAIWLPVKKK